MDRRGRHGDRRRLNRCECELGCSTADNTTLNPGVGGDVIANDDIGGIKFQRLKIVFGSDGVNEGDVTRQNPLPVQIATPTATVATLIVSTDSTSNAWATLTLPAGGAGTFQYLTTLRIGRVWHPGYTNQIATVQTANMNGARFLLAPIASITNANNDLNFAFNPPLRCATANTVTNFGMLPAGTNIKWTAFCGYYLA